MRAALQRAEFRTESLLDHGMVVFDPEEPDKKVEPYYFDGRRGNNAQSRDIGFAPDALQMTTAAFPAVEFLCLVGLQRVRPQLTDEPRVFEYCTWGGPSLPEIVPALASGVCADAARRRYRFENAFRTDQRKHKAFLPATPVGDAR
jgi:CRISPR-associated protein Csb3